MSTDSNPRNSDKAENRKVLAVFPSKHPNEKPTIKLIKLQDLDVSQATKHAMPRTARRAGFERISDRQKLFTINFHKLNHLDLGFNIKRSVRYVNTIYYMSPEQVELVVKWYF